MKQWNLLADLDMSEEQVLARLFSSDPERAWDCIAEAVGEGERESAFGIQHWLNDSSHRLLGDDRTRTDSIRAVRQSIGVGGRKRGGAWRWLISALAKTLDRTPAGRLTRDFIAKYGKVECLSTSLWRHFHARGWSGSDSAYYRKLREEAREWLVGEKNQTVVRWIENYIDELGYGIQRAEIEEERRY